MHLETPCPKTELYDFFGNFICFVSTDFILEIKDVPNESDTKIHLLKSFSMFYPVIFYGCTIQKYQRCLMKLLKNHVEHN